MPSPPASILVRRVLKEETDRMGSLLGQVTEEYVGGHPYVFSGPDNKGRKRDQIRLVHQRVSERTGMSMETLAERYPGWPDLFSHRCKVLMGTYREDPALMRAHQERMAAKLSEGLPAPAHG